MNEFDSFGSIWKFHKEYWIARAKNEMNCCWAGDGKCRPVTVENMSTRYIDFAASNVSGESQCRQLCHSNTAFNCRSYSSNPSTSQCFISSENRGMCMHFLINPFLIASSTIHHCRFLNKHIHFKSIFISLFRHFKEMEIAFHLM